MAETITMYENKLFTTKKFAIPKLMAQTFTCGRNYWFLKNFVYILLVVKTLVKMAIYVVFSEEENDLELSSSVFVMKFCKEKQETLFKVFCIL